MQATRKLLLVFAFLFPASIFRSSVGAHAQAVQDTRPLPRGWLKVARLPAGEPVSVQVRSARVPTACALVWIDNTALACDAAAPGGPAERLVFPAAQVDSVRRNAAHSSSGMSGSSEGCGDGKRILVGALIGSAAGGLILGQSSGRAGAVGAMLGAGVGAGIAVGPQGFGPPVRPVMAVRFPLRTPGFLRVH